MLKNYYIAALRNLTKNKVFSLINILGLSAGLATFLLISLYVYQEYSFDRYHKKADRIFRIVENLETEREILYQSVSSPPMGPAFQQQFAEVENYVRLLKRDFRVRINDKVFVENECYFADSSIFQVFSFPLLRGNPVTALTEPHTVVLSQSSARKFFGELDPLDQSLEVNGEVYKITGVMADIPKNSHFAVNILASFSTWSEGYNHEFKVSNELLEQAGWFLNGIHTYILLRDKSHVARLRPKMKDFIKRNINRGGLYYQDLPLQALTDIYMKETQRTFENGTRGSLSNVYILSMIALFVLVIACLNYVNLATARASSRMKEVGIRKVLGALRGSLVTQFLLESMIVCTMATIVGVVLALLALPLFNTLLETELSFNFLPKLYLMGGLGILVLALSFLSGLYPAMVVSGFRPLDVFRPSLISFFSHQSFRKILVSIQFVISITLIAGTLLVFDQLSLVRTRDVGFKKEATVLVQIKGNEEIRGRIETVKNQFLSLPEIISATAANRMPGEQTTNLYAHIETGEGKMLPTAINTNFVDVDFLPSFGIPIVAGRNFSREFVADDSTAFIINETAMRHLGLTFETAIGKKVNQSGKVGHIVGVCKDFYYRSLHFNIEPLILTINPLTYNTIALKINSDNITGVIADIQNVWTTVAPEYTLGYAFLEDDYKRLYRSDEKLGKVAGVFSGLAIMIGCLGLLGLTSFSVTRRVKEIGIRKILGATVTQVMLLISKEIILLIGIAFLISIPITYFCITEWLSGFTERIEIGGSVFIVAGLSVLIVACLSVSFLSFKAAAANPSDSLRQE